MYTGTSQTRLDAYDKVTGRAKFTEDICPEDALAVTAVHATVANGLVLGFDLNQALAVPGVVKILTCFESPEYKYDTGNHPWDVEPEFQPGMTQQVLTKRVRYYGDVIAAVIAKDPESAAKARDLIKVRYEEYEPLLDVASAMHSDAAPLHDAYPGNIFGHSVFSEGDYEAAVREPDLTIVEGWYEVPMVKHMQLEPTICYAYMEGGYLTVVTPTQTPHPHRRVIGQALGIPWGKIRIKKPYVGGGFGNREDCLYEPLCAWACMQVNGLPVRMYVTREEEMMSTRVRHGIRWHITSHIRPDGTIAARYAEAFSNKGAYGHHGHAIVCKASTAFSMLYESDAWVADVYTVFTNTETAGAMRGYGAPQGVFATEAHTDDICARMGFDPVEFRRKNMMKPGAVNAFQGLTNYCDSLRQCMDLALKESDYFQKYEAYQNQTGPIRKGIGISAFWYNTGAWPFLMEISTSRMTLNQDGSVQVQSPEIEFGQGTDTVFAQMAADVLHMPIEKIHIVTAQDTDFVGYGSGAYASRQTYTGGAGIYETAKLLRGRILNYASELTGEAEETLEIEGEQIICVTDGHPVISLEALALESFYSLKEQKLLTAEKTVQLKTNALSLGVCIAEVRVDLTTGRIDPIDILNVHDCGRVMNPKLAEGQVHGGISMGIGYALSEKLKINEQGRILNNNMLDYKLPGAMDHTGRIRARFIENPEPTHPFGAKSLGEPPVVPVAPAIRNAVRQATCIGFNELPLDPQTCLLRFKKEGLS